MLEALTLIDEMLQKLEALPEIEDDYEVGVLGSVLRLRQQGRAPSVNQLAFLVRMIERYCPQDLWLAAEIRGQLRLL